MRKFIFALTVITGLVIIGCSDTGIGPETGNGNNGNGNEEEIPTYNVTVSVTPTDAGSVTPSADSTYEEGEEVELQAEPNEGYLFAGWSGDVDSTSENPLSLTVDQDYSLTANYELKSYELTVNTEGEGTVSERVLQEKSKEYDHGTKVELTANPAEGWKFVEWKGDTAATENPLHLTVEEPKEVTAVFEKKSYELTINTEGEGAVDEEIANAKSYEHGTVVNLTANPSEGWQFVEWKGDFEGTANPAEITVDDPKEVTAVFEKKTFEISLSTTGEGSITKDPDQQAYEYNTTVTLTANPAEGYQFVEWQEDLNSTENQIELTIDSDKELTAIFAKKTYELTINTQGEGSVTEEVIQAKSYDHGTQVRLIANPDDGWQFVEWQGDVAGMENPAQITVDDPNEVTAVFVKKSYKLTVNTNGEGSVAKNPDQTEYKYNSSVELTANPSEGWEFVEWQGDVSSTSNPLDITIGSDKEVTAVFKKKTFTLSVETSGEGSVSLNPDQTEYEYGTEVELSASASGDWAFDKWEGDVTGEKNPKTSRWMPINLSLRCLKIPYLLGELEQ